MYIARILYPVQVLGPGNRVGIWFDGCVHHCHNCSNPELWEQQDRYAVTKDRVLALISKISDEHPVDGFTLTGGDPFYQPDALRELLPELQKISTDILVYTGYLNENIKEKYPDILEQIAVLIDGPYINERNNNCVLRGSDNQRIYIKDEFKEKYDSYLMNTSNGIQNFTSRDGVISVGIHSREFNNDLQSKLSISKRSD